MDRHKSRYKIMTILYQVFLYRKNKIEVNLEKIINEQIEEENEYIESSVKGIIDNEEVLEEKANKYLNNWTLDRLGYTDQAIIKLAIYEMLYTDTGDKICINEAIELAKQYSDENVVKMINGVLDKIHHNSIESSM